MLPKTKVVAGKVTIGPFPETVLRPLSPERRLQRAMKHASVRRSAMFQPVDMNLAIHVRAIRVSVNKRGTAIRHSPFQLNVLPELRGCAE